MTRAVILIAHGFQDEEFCYPYYRMLEEGWEVDIASNDGGVKQGKYGLPARANRDFNFLTPQYYDIVFVPGGFECPDRLRMDKRVQDFVRGMDTAGKIIAAICHGPWVLVSAGVASGRTLTCYDSIKPDLMNAGALVSMASVVRDRNLVTADHYRNNGGFMRQVIAAANSTITRSESPHAI